MKQSEGSEGENTACANSITFWHEQHIAIGDQEIQ